MSKKDELDVEALSLLLIEGDSTAFSKIYAAYSPLLLQKLMHLLPDEESALDIHQVTFVKLWEYRAKIRVKDGIWPLLYKIARNLVVDYFRKSASNEAIKKALLLQATLFYEIDEPTDNLENMSEALSAAISLLPKKRKEIFLLCKMQGKSYEEVANMQGISIGTVKDHMAKAMRFLKQELGEKLFVFLLLLLNYFK